MHKFFSTINTIIVCFLLTFMFTPVNTLGIGTAAFIVNGVILYIFNFKNCNNLFIKNIYFILVAVAFPIVMIAINLVLHDDLSSYLLRVNLTLIPIPFLGLLIYNFNSISNFKPIRIAFAIGILVALVRAIISYKLGSPRFYDAAKYSTIYSGMFSSIYASSCLYIFLDSFKNKKVILSWLSLFAFLIMAFVCLYIASKGAIVTLIFMCFIILKRFFNLSKTFIIFILGWMVITGVYAVIVPNNTLISRFRESSHSINNFIKDKKQLPSSTGLRIQFYEEALICFREHPIVGCSDKQVVELKKKLISEGKQDPQVLDFNHFHSDFFNTIGRAGIIGLFAWLLFWGSLIWFVFKLQKTVANKSLLGISLTIFLSVIGNSLFETMTYRNVGTMSFLLAICTVFYIISLIIRIMKN